jgi:hypothetical protein
VSATLVRARFAIPNRCRGYGHLGHYFAAARHRGTLPTGGPSRCWVTLNQPPRAPGTPGHNQLFFSMNSAIPVVLPSDRLKLTHYGFRVALAPVGDFAPYKTLRP